MTPKMFAKHRLMDMYERPELWASTKEAFGLQLALLAEFYTIESLSLETKRDVIFVANKILSVIFGPGNVVPKDALDTEWAKSRVLAVLKAIEG